MSKFCQLFVACIIIGGCDSPPAPSNNTNEQSITVSEPIVWHEYAHHLSPLHDQIQSDLTSCYRDCAKNDLSDCRSDCIKNNSDPDLRNDCVNDCSKEARSECRMGCRIDTVASKYPQVDIDWNLYY
jgi:hypothetical protein